MKGAPGNLQTANDGHQQVSHSPKPKAANFVVFLIYQLPECILFPPRDKLCATQERRKFLRIAYPLECNLDSIKRGLKIRESFQIGI